MIYEGTNCAFDPVFTHLTSLSSIATSGYCIEYHRWSQLGHLLRLIVTPSSARLVHTTLVLTKEHLGHAAMIVLTIYGAGTNMCCACSDRLPSGHLTP